MLSNVPIFFNFSDKRYSVFIVWKQNHASLICHFIVFKFRDAGINPLVTIDSHAFQDTPSLQAV